MKKENKVKVLVFAGALIAMNIVLKTFGAKYRPNPAYYSQPDPGISCRILVWTGSRRYLRIFG